MEKYLESGELSVEEIKAGVRARTIANDIVPVVLRYGVQEQRRPNFIRCSD